VNLIQRTARACRGIAAELRNSSRALGGRRPTYAADILASRLLAVTRWVPSNNELRTVISREGITIHYRRNRGDIQSVREVYLDDVYRLPDNLRPRTLVDLGANIGLVSTLYARRYDLARVVAVEPVPANVEVLRHNLKANRVRAEVVEAAVGPQPRRARFVLSEASNLGHLGEDGDLEVPVVTMPALLAKLGGRTDLLKIDVEGGEGALLVGADVSWLDNVHAIIAEIHPDRVDYEEIVKAVTSRGFRYHPAGSLWPTSMDMFLRD
jgi:FkbM family methyltransferase